MREGRLQRDAVGLHYIEWPAPEECWPPLLLLHGLSSNALIWKRVAPLLAGRRVVALDQRSHGRSDAPGAGYSNELLAADAAFAISQLGLQRPLVAGHSWGAVIALELAATQPELVSGLAVVDGPVTPMSLFMTWEEAAARMQPPLPVWPGLEQAAEAVQSFLKEAWADDLRDFVAAGAVQDGSSWRPTLTAPVRLEILQAMFRAQPELLLPRVEGPILIAAAAEYRDWRERQVAMATEIRPDATVRWYDSAHDIPLIRPAELAADLERLALRAAFREVQLEVEALTGDWSRAAHGDADGWTAKDLLAHLVSTQVALPGIVKAAVTEAPPAGGPAFDPARWNASQLARRRELPAEALKSELGAATEALDPLLAAAGLEAVNGQGTYAGLSLRDTLRNLQRHQMTHLGELRGALGAPGAGA